MCNDLKNFESTKRKAEKRVVVNVGFVRIRRDFRLLLFSLVKGEKEGYEKYAAVTS